MPVTVPSLVAIDDHGIARIAGSRISVAYIAVEKTALGWSPEKIQKEHAHLTLAQVYAALSYYYEHQAEIDAKIERDNREVERLRAEAEEPPVVKRLRELRKLR